MATYLQGASNIHPNGLQTLTLMNPALLAYSDAATPLTVSSMNHPHILHPNHTQNSSMIPTNVQGLVSYLHYNNSVDASSQLGLSLSSHATAPFWPASDVQSDIHGNQSALTGPKYLKAVQELLDEAINVGKGVSVRCRIKKEGDARQKSGGGCITRLKQGIELTIQEKQAVQMKKAMLVSMLLEVEQRYRQYHNQMQLLVCSFEAVAGIGSARAYTALALQRVSKQFRCLRDAINGQIQATRKCLGEEEEEGLGETNNSLGSKLRFVDRQLRQERALQQIGVVQSNAWRPQRGLPERAVTVLRSWLFEHFLHPYPKDSEKSMLAKQTGLTKSQVSNWFINARVRLWKPMVEEMYLEETKNQQPDNADDKTISSNHSENSPTNSTKKDHASETAANLQLKKAISDASRQQNTMPSILEDSMIKYGHRGLSSIADAMDQETSLEAYQIGDIAAFEPNQFVSLSLRLPSQSSYIPCEFMPLQSSIDMRGDESIDDYFSIKSSNAAVVVHPSEAYDCMRFQNRKSSAAQLLPDLVA